MIQHECWIQLHRRDDSTYQQLLRSDDIRYGERVVPRSWMKSIGGHLDFTFPISSRGRSYVRIYIRVRTRRSAALRTATATARFCIHRQVSKRFKLVGSIE